MTRLALTVLLLLTACGGVTSVEVRPAGPGPAPEPVGPPIAAPATTVVVAPDPVIEPDGVQELVLVYIETGGCAMMGPNCATYQLWSDGTVEVFRSSFDEVGDVPEDTGFLDPSIPAKIRRLAGEIPADFLASLPEGSCQGCVDGIDVTIVIQLGLGASFHIDSITHQIPWNDPLFASIEIARTQMGELAPLPLVTR